MKKRYLSYILFNIIVIGYVDYINQLPKKLWLYDESKSLQT